MSLVRFVLRGIVLPIGAVSAAAAIIALGGRFSGRLDILTHFAPLYLAGGAVTLAAAIFAHRRLLPALLGAAAVVASLSLMLPELLRPQSPRLPPNAPGQIKLIQFNAARDSDGLEQRLAWLAAEDPDVLVVEDSRPLFQTAVTQRLGRQMSCGKTCEVAIFTRTPAERIEAPRRGRKGLGPAITIAHLAGPSGEFTVMGVHYVWPTNVENHAENSARLQQLMKGRSRERLILVGDFNSTPWSFSRRREDAALGLERRTYALPTWPADRPFGLALLPIDHVYAGSDWGTVSITRGPRLGSDHYPVVAVLAPKSN
ncbi:MAG: endonuclease [Phenylobacterium sp.]|uniref:endonuclease/exonuclease/phosphatase family protein n=1 Tax=Phenylobacterium sp. TaxID=1871053 RepID=UPI0025E8D3B5|nr:endonuclease/exonuclease/phosphatase family protein [Phenylobacterium sp.]MBA4011539.1 endonuclease [Phenylobacterium sp.]